jgi:hypothetical protein
MHRAVLAGWRNTADYVASSLNGLARTPPLRHQNEIPFLSAFIGVHRRLNFFPVPDIVSSTRQGNVNFLVSRQWHIEWSGNPVG